jgi:hypothetical protein
LFFRIRSRKLLKDRTETFRCLACHPTYTRASSDDKVIYKQNLIYFFDKRFTDQMRMLTGTKTLGIFLRLGSDSAFQHNEDLDTGGEEGDDMVDRNVTIWAESLKYLSLSQNVDVAMSRDSTATCEEPATLPKNQCYEDSSEFEGNVRIAYFSDSEKKSTRNASKWNHVEDMFVAN